MGEKTDTEDRKNERQSGKNALHCDRKRQGLFLTDILNKLKLPKDGKVLEVQLLPTESLMTCFNNLVDNSDG